MTLLITIVLRTDIDYPCYICFSFLLFDTISHLNHLEDTTLLPNRLQNIVFKPNKELYLSITLIQVRLLFAVLWQSLCIKIYSN